ncbi:hypothetical protein CRG98_018305 [Punica granatum]|uniref:G-patch domain-containing protein n=1 Tax=Punica granatum TaxID=22663 RepID=A0A2I0JY94_PUNGR|nr:hypothetical protein CRG98_018305 [Punica granatum]
MEGPTSKGEESSKKAPATTMSSSGRRGKEVSINAVNPAHPTPQQYSANPLPDHRPSSGSSINMISICTLGEDANAQDNPLPFVIDYTPEEPTVGFAGHMASPAPFVVDIPAREPYLDNKVPWTYEGGIGGIERQFSVMGVTHSGRVYENPVIIDKGKAPAAEVGTVPESTPFPSKRVTEEEAEAFMKIIKASEYKVVEQMAKSPAHISLLALLLSSEPHREALLRVLTAAQVPKETPPDRIEETVGSIFSNTISFSDDELPSEGWTHSRALHIVCKCNNYIIGRVMIDNGSALNVCPVTTLKQMNVDLNRVCPSKTATVVPYISVGDDENLPFHSFETISIIRDYGEIGPSRANRMIRKFLLHHNYIPGAGFGARGQGINRPIEVEEYKNRRGLGFRPSCHEIIEARRGNHLHRLAAHYGKLNRGIPVPPLSHFFPGPPRIIEGTLDGPSSDSDDAPIALSAVYAITEEIPSGVHIRLAQENEELDNWTSVPRYSAVIADVLHSNPNLRHFNSNPFEEHLEEVVKQINAGFLEVCNYSEWVANIVPVEKKDRRVQVCVDYRDLNKASPKDNFPLPHIDVLVDNTARHAQFSFMDGFSGYNQIRIAEEDKDYYSSPDNRRRMYGHRVTNDKRKQGPLGEHERAIGGVNRRQAPKTAETGTVALFITESPKHRKGPPGSRKKPQMTLRNSTWLPEGRFNGHERLPASLRGIFMAKQGSQPSSNTSRHSGNTEEAPVASP